MYSRNRDCLRYIIPCIQVITGIMVIIIIIIIIIIHNHIGHCTQTEGSADVKVQNILHGRNNITYRGNCE